MTFTKALAIATVLLSTGSSAWAASLGHLRVSHQQGDVLIKTPEAAQWGPLSINAPLAEGDQLWAAEGGRVELHLDTGAYVRLDEQTALQVLSAGEESGFYLSEGRAHVFVQASEGGEALGRVEIETPGAAVRAFMPAAFQVSVGGDAGPEVAVYEGAVEVEYEGAVTRVNAGETLQPGTGRAVLAHAGSRDEWVRWNRDRDGALVALQGTSSNHLPPELQAYGRDLEGYGDWVAVPEYGYVWRPEVGLGPDWAPYRDGHWFWRGGDYVWVGQEPWGWAPYHFGRWAFIPRAGWCWVPPPPGAVHWAPAYVGWVRTPAHVGWVPLAPGDLFFGRGHFGPHSVDVTRAQRVHVTRVSRNVRVRGAVTLVDRHRFAAGSAARVRLPRKVLVEEVFVPGNVAVRGPEIRPEKPSFFPGGRGLSQTRLPPERIRFLDREERRHRGPSRARRLDRSGPGGPELDPGASAIGAETRRGPALPGTDRLQADPGRGAGEEGGAQVEVGPGREGRSLLRDDAARGRLEGGRASRGEGSGPAALEERRSGSGRGLRGGGPSPVAPNPAFRGVPPERRLAPPANRPFRREPVPPPARPPEVALPERQDSGGPDGGSRGRGSGRREELESGTGSGGSGRGGHGRRGRH